jgi:hypothetical protein
MEKENPGVPAPGALEARVFERLLSTYEGLKHRLALEWRLNLIRLLSTYEGLKPKAGFGNIYPPHYLEPTYEGLKLCLF